MPSVSPPVFVVPLMGGATIDGGGGAWLPPVLQPVCGAWWELDGTVGPRGMGMSGASVVRFDFPAPHRQPAFVRNNRIFPVDFVIRAFRAARTLAVPPKLAVPIVNLTAPQIIGDFVEGQVVTASPGTWTGTPPLTFSYQWRRCDAGGASCVNIAGATSPQYIVQAADVGGTLRVEVTASDT